MAQQSKQVLQNKSLPHFFKLSSPIQHKKESHPNSGGNMIKTTSTPAGAPHIHHSPASSSATASPSTSPPPSTKIVDPSTTTPQKNKEGTSITFSPSLPIPPPLPSSKSQKKLPKKTEGVELNLTVAPSPHHQSTSKASQIPSQQRDEASNRSYESQHASNSLESPSSYLIDNSSLENSSLDLTSHASKTDEENNVYFRNLFKLPANEKIVEDFYCAYFKKILHQGRMYISQNFVCFHSNIFGFKIILVMAFRDIVSITKQNTALVVPNAIEINTTDGHTHFFGSFMFRDQTFAILSELLRIHKKRVAYLQQLQKQKANNSKNQSSRISVSEDEDTDSETDSESGYDEDSEEEDDDDGNDDEEDGLQDESSNKIGTQIVQNYSKDAENEKTHGQQQDGTTSTGGNSTSGNVNSGSSSSGAINGVAGSGNTGMGGSGGDGDDEKRKKKKKDEDEYAGQNEKDKQKNGVNQDQGDEDNDQNDDQDEYGYESDNITDISQITHNDIFMPDSKVKGKEIFKGNLDANVNEIIKILFSADGEIEKDYHQSRGDSNLVIGDFEYAKDGCGRVREITFVSPINGPIGPKQSRIITSQRVIIFKGKKKCINQFSMVSLDAPYGDSFRIQADMEYNEIDDNCTEMRMTLGVVFVKSILLKWKVEDAVNKETTQSLLMWVQKAKDILKRNKPLLKSKGKKSAKKKEKKGKKKKKSKTPPPPPTSSENPISSSSSSPNITADQGMLSMILDFIMNVPVGLMSYSVHIPLGIFLIMLILMSFVILPQQQKTIQKLNTLETNIQLYKHEAILLNQELNYILFNLTKSSSHTDFEQRLKDHAEKKHLKESTMMKELIASTLHEMKQLKKHINNQLIILQSTTTHNPTESILKNINLDQKVDPATATLLIQLMQQQSNRNTYNPSSPLWAQESQTNAIPSSTTLLWIIVLGIGLLIAIKIIKG